MSWVVISKFRDLETNHVYRKGDKFPFQGRAKKERIASLSTDANRMKKPLIEKQEANEKTETVQEAEVVEEEVVEEKE